MSTYVMLEWRRRIYTSTKTLHPAAQSEWNWFSYQLILFFVRQMGPSRSNHPNNYIETETRHPFITAEFALKNFSHIVLCSCARLFILTVPRFILEFNGYRRTDRTTWRNAEQGVGWGEGGRNMSRTSIPAKGRIAILLVTSRYRNKNTLLLDRHRGSSTDLSLCTK